MNATDVIASVALVAGGLMSLLAGIAVLRFPDTMSRIHAATKPQVLGIMLLMLGVGLRLGSPAVIGMLVLIVVLQFVTAPVSAHLAVRVAFRNAEDDDADPSAATSRRPSERSAGAAADDSPELTEQAALQESATESAETGEEHPR
jgi:multicomponent Na+:H+ antiporter subunit G